MGETVSSRGLPSLATVVDRFRDRPRNFECLDGFESVFGVGNPSVPRKVWLLVLLIRKKFLSFCVVGVCVPESGLLFFLDEKERLEKLRFSVAMVQSPS